MCPKSRLASSISLISDAAFGRISRNWNYVTRVAKRLSLSSKAIDLASARASSQRLRNIDADMYALASFTDNQIARAMLVVPRGHLLDQRTQAAVCRRSTSSSASPAAFPLPSARPISGEPGPNLFRVKSLCPWHRSSTRPGSSRFCVCVSGGRRLAVGGQFSLLHGRISVHSEKTGVQVGSGSGGCHSMTSRVTPCLMRAYYRLTRGRPSWLSTKWHWHASGPRRW